MAKTKTSMTRTLRRMFTTRAILIHHLRMMMAMMAATANRMMVMKMMLSGLRMGEYVANGGERRTPLGMRMAMQTHQKTAKMTKRRKK